MQTKILSLLGANKIRAEDFSASADFYPSMFDFIADPTLTVKEQLTSIIMRFRKNFWLAGSVNDIKVGNYFVMSLYHDFMRDKSDFSYVRTRCQFELVQYQSWTCGLKNNVLLNIKGLPILVMDNHNFALPFIIYQFINRVLDMNCSMLHIDHHEDLNINYEFSLKQLLETEDINKKLEYFLKTTEIGSWQYHPLFGFSNEKTFVDKNKWQWLYLDKIADNRAEWGCVHHPDKKMAVSLKAISKSADLVDVDIDFLIPLEKTMSVQEKMQVLQGIIPIKILLKLQEVASLCSAAKAVTIATSPGFINQQRAIVYVKTLLNLIAKAR
ncbi:MAG: UPF0489 family protein [Candidatus Margulisbacteria bacterium]|nr:UPF0489 family protein [Candidatus Margulisiibacteriota bacterium]